MAGQVELELRVKEQPLELADLSLLHQLSPHDYPHLFESASLGPLGRYDVLFCFPESPILLEDLSKADDFEEKFRQQCNLYKVRGFLADSAKLNQLNLPFYGGWLVFFAYEYSQLIEPKVQLAKPEVPYAYMQFCPATIVLDKQESQVYFVAQTDEQLTKLQEDYAQAAKLEVKDDFVRATSLVEEDPAKYLQAITKVQQAIKQDEVTQVNLSRLWQAETQASALVNFRQLRQANPAPFAAMANLQGSKQTFSILSASPERFIKQKDGWVDSRPIAGTRPRTGNFVQDSQMLQELAEHPKDRQEHQLLLDLVAEDLAKVALPNSLEVTEFRVLESYEFVHHLVSNVRAELRVGVDSLDLIKAMFPGGSITGSPKLRSIELISEWENRGAYTGALGYINYDGSMDLSILIRSLVQSNNKLEFRAGAGIIAESDPAKELAETRDKAKGILRSLGLDD